MLFRFFHARPLLLIAILVIASILGVAGYLKMPRNMYPDVEWPQVAVVTQLPGAAAQSVAQKLSRPIEQELYALSGVRDVQSTSRNEVSTVRVEFEYEKGLSAALLDVNNALSRARGKLPAEAPASSVYAIGAFTNPVMVLTLSPKSGGASSQSPGRPKIDLAPSGGGSGAVSEPGAQLTLAQVRLLAENRIKAVLLAQPRIATVDVFGGYEPAVRVSIDPMKLARYRIGQAQLQEALAKLNRDWPMGTLQGTGANLTLTVYGERADMAALRLLPLTQSVTLGDVAELSFTHADRNAAYHGNGKPGIALAIQRAPGGAVQGAIEDAEALLPVLRANYPNIEFAVSDTQGELIKISNASMMRALIDAVSFTGLVILLFLGNWRALATAMVSVPLVFLITLAVLWLLGRELNILVLTGIILSLGMLVDDAVVVLENIERHMALIVSAKANVSGANVKPADEAGGRSQNIERHLDELHEDRVTAVRRGTEEVLYPVFVGTLATAAVLTPLMFVGDFPQQVYQHMIFTVVIAVFVSYFVAVTFIPRLSAWWYRNGLPPRNRLERGMEATYRRVLAPGAGGYANMLGFAFRGDGWRGQARRIVLVLLPFALLVFTFKAVPPVIGTEAMPPMDTGNVRVHVRFGANEPVALAEQRLKAFEEKLMQDPRVQRVSAIFGSEPGVLSLGSGQSPAEATLNISYVTRFERDETSWAIENDLRRQVAALPGVTVADAYDSGTTALSTVKAPVDIRLSADDWRLLPEAADQVRAALGTVPGLTSVSPTWDGYTTEARLVLDEAKLRGLGLTPETVFNQLPLKGMAASSLSKLPAAGAVPVRAYFAEPWRSNPAALTLLPIPLPDGHTVTLGEIGKIVQQPGLNLLTGSQLRYTVDILAYRETLPVSLLSERAQSAARKVLPPGVAMEDKGDNDAGGHSTQRMRNGLGVGLLLLVGILVPAYGSVSLAFLSVLILPLSAIGALWGLLAFDKALGMPATLGIILLCSIVIKNSILMVDFIQERRREGEGPLDAALGSIRLRYRPILMTAFGTIAGMLPIALQQAVGLERLSPLAVSAIGGLLLGTVLSLFYLPLFYVWVTGKGRAGK